MSECVALHTSACTAPWLDYTARRENIIQIEEETDYTTRRGNRLFS